MSNIANDLVKILQNADATIDNLTTDRDAAMADATQAHAVADNLDQQLAVAVESRDQWRTTASSLEDTIEELKRQLATYEDPEPIKVLFGACPSGAGGYSAAAIQRIIDKWGTKAVARVFVNETGSWALPAVPSSVRLLHISWKPDITKLLSGAFDSQLSKLVAWATALQTAGTRVVLEVFHEADVKVRQGIGLWSDYLAAKNYFGHYVRNANPTLRTGHTMSVWTFTPSAKLNPDTFAGVIADVLGVDCDGMNSPDAYPDFTDAIWAAQKWAKAHGYSLAIPEFGHERITNDTGGSKRALWMDQQAKVFEATGAEYVCFFDFSKDSIAAGSPEAKVWSLWTA